MYYTSGSLFFCFVFLVNACLLVSVIAVVVVVVLILAKVILTGC